MSAFVVEDAVINRVVTLIGSDKGCDEIRKLVLENTGADIRFANGTEDKDPLFAVRWMRPRVDGPPMGVSVRGLRAE